MKNASSRRRSQTSFHPRLESLETRLTPTTYTVSSLADSGAGSLRAAITSVNENAGISTDEIDFSVAGVIQLTSGALPAITNTVKIDGTTAPGFAGVPLIELDAHGFAGLTFSGASNCTLASLSIVNANGAGVMVYGSFGDRLNSPTGTNFTLVGSYIGLTMDGSVAGNTGFGLVIEAPASDTIGGALPVDRNVISGNGAGGIQLESTGANILNNFIGTGLSGGLPAPNQGNGITISGYGVTVGGTDPGDGNVIAFNTQSGVTTNPGNGVLGNSIYGNGSKGIDVEGAPANNGNGNQTLPVPELSYVVESAASLTGSAQVQVGGVLNVPTVIPDESASLTYTIQVFATLSDRPAGQGELFLGSVQVNTNSEGFAAFTLNASVQAGSGTTFTATASTPVYATLNTSEFSPAFAIGGNPNSLFVASAYGLLLNRYPDTGAAYWVNLMNNGESAPGVALSLEGSTEYLNDQVTAMYKLYLGRNPDTAGEQAWTGFLQAGGALEQVAAGLTSSQEFYVLQGGTNQAFITELYYDVLHRYAPSTGEIGGWETALDAGASRAGVAAAFLTSQEYRANLVQNDYLAYLLRTTDSGGVTAWVDALNAGATDQQVLAQIFGSPEGYELWS